MKNNVASLSGPLVTLVALILVAGCGRLVDESDPAYLRAQQVRSLEVPPDLSTTNTSSNLPAIVAEEASSEDLKDFEKFQQFEQFDEFEQYQQWKAQRSPDEELDFEAFRLAKKANERSSASGAGVKLEENFDGSVDIRIDAQTESSFEYVGSALGSLSVFVVSSEPDDLRFIAELPELQSRKLSLPGAKRFSIQVNRDSKDSLVSIRDHRAKPVINEAAKAFQTRLASQIRVHKLRAELANRVDSAAELAGQLRTDENGHLLLDLEQDRDDVFRQVDYLLDQIGFTVVERQPQQRRFVVRFALTDNAEPKKKGLAKLAFWRDDKEKSGSDEGELYAIAIEPLAGGSRIRVTNENNETGDVGDNIIQILRDNL
jgi:uncharacterized lipoprotein